MLIERNGTLGVECDGRFIPAISGGWAFSTATLIAMAISVALSIAAAAVQYMQQQAQAEAASKNQAAQMKAQDAAIAQNAALANRAYMEDTKALQERQRQSDEATAAREQGVSIQAAQARSTALTAAGESGVSGLSVNALMDDFTRQEVDYRFQSRTNLGYEHTQTEAELEAKQITAEGRTQSMKPYQAQPVQYPSLMGAALRVGADTFGAYQKYKSPQVPSTPGSTDPSWT